MKFVEDCAPMIKGSSVLAAQSAQRRLIPMQRGGEVKYCRAASACPRLKVHEESNQPNVYRPTFAIK